MATRTVQFVLSTETDPRYQAAMVQVGNAKGDGFQVTDVRRIEIDQDGVKVAVGEIELTKNL